MMPTWSTTVSPAGRGGPRPLVTCSSLPRRDGKLLSLLTGMDMTLVGAVHGSAAVLRADRRVPLAALTVAVVRPRRLLAACPPLPKCCWPHPYRAQGCRRCGRQGPGRCQSELADCHRSPAVGHGAYRQSTHP